MNDAGMSKQYINVKILVGLKCQNNVGMSKHCRYIFVKMVRVYKTGLHYHHLPTCYASLIIERSKRLIKESENWIMLLKLTLIIPKKWNKSFKLSLLALPAVLIYTLAA